jgi:hypothetical protein
VSEFLSLAQRLSPFPVPCFALSFALSEVGFALSEVGFALSEVGFALSEVGFDVDKSEYVDKRCMSVRANFCPEYRI